MLGVGIGVPPKEEFGTFGEPTGVRERAERLDEALDVITGMWSGEPFSYDGKHYRVAETTFMPRPMQQPRIPIWVAGTWPNKGPFRRASRFDGVFPLADDNGSPNLITPQGVREVVMVPARPTQRTDTACGRGSGWRHARRSASLFTWSVNSGKDHSRQKVWRKIV